MKIQILNINGEKEREIEMPKFFLEEIREDLIQKVYLAIRKNMKHPYAPYLWAGMQHSASGKIRHARRKWKGAYGYGISRVPRKIMTKKGSRFNWVGATVSSARGGRENHPPKIDVREKRINKKEFMKALFSAIAATGSQLIIKNKYGLEIKTPVIIDGKVLKLKTKQLASLIKKIFNSDKKILFIIGEKENIKTKIIDVATPKKLDIINLASGGTPGRLAVYTEQAIKELEQIK